ncbi:MAG: DUF192 domain-containing protein [Planctomycetota bacterium]
MARRTLMVLVSMLAALTFAVCAPGCGNGPPTDQQLVSVTIANERFFLEPAIDLPTRVQGLSGRAEIARDGGMIFVFPRASRQGFVMRDCLVPIDILFVADNGVIDSMHAMQIDPRQEGESAGDYEHRLRRYMSDGRVRIAIELAGGTIDRLNLKPSDRVSIDGLDDLKARAR